MSMAIAAGHLSVTFGLPPSALCTRTDGLLDGSDVRVFHLGGLSDDLVWLLQVASLEDNRLDGSNRQSVRLVRAR